MILNIGGVCTRLIFFPFKHHMRPALGVNLQFPGFSASAPKWGEKMTVVFLFHKAAPECLVSVAKSHGRDSKCPILGVTSFLVSSVLL